MKHVFVLTALAAASLLAQEKVPVQMTVTIEASHGKDVPDLAREDVMVYRDKERLLVTQWTPLKNERAGMELYILIDDASAMSVSSQLGDLRQFIEKQPKSSLIGVGYVRADYADIIQPLTTDHEKAARALRLPFGRIAEGTSPFLALSDLIKKWPTCCVRREVILISSGVDALGGGPQNPFLDLAIEQAQRAGVIIYSIYTPRFGHGGHSFWRMNWGQNHLAQISEETGGEAYMLGFGPPVSFAPYLDDIAGNLRNQYTVEFMITPSSRPAMVPIRFATEIPNVEISAAPKVFIPSALPTGEER